MNTILTRDQEEYLKRQPIPQYGRTYAPALQRRLDVAREQNKPSIAIDALLDFVSSHGGLAGIDPKTFHWLREKRRDDTL